MKNPNPINIHAIDHVVLRANNLERMISFYCEVLGCRLERVPGDLGLAQLRAGQSLIDLIDANGPLLKQDGSAQGHGAPNMDHLALQIIPWDFSTIKTHLESYGVVVGKTVSRYGAMGTGPSIYIEDPEGNTIELKGVRTAIE